MADDTKPDTAEPLSPNRGESPDPSEIRNSRQLARTTGFVAGAFALAGIVAGVVQRGDLALWCIPVFIVLAAISNTANQDARRLARGTPDSPSVARQVGEGILGTFLALLLLALAAIGYLFYMLSHG